MAKRFRPTPNERSEIVTRLRERRHERGASPLTPSTEGKIVSLVNHLLKTVNKPQSEITKQDLILFYNNSKYSFKTIGWANSILRGYFNFSVPSIEEVGQVHSTTTLTIEGVTESLQRMHHAMNRGSGQVASFASVLLILLTSHKCSAVLQLTGYDVSQLVANGGVDANGITYTILPHLAHIQVDGNSLVQLLSIVSVGLDHGQHLENAPSLLSLCAGAGVAYSDFYKFSRDALRSFVASVPENRQHFAQELLDLERGGFRGRGTVYDYTKWLLSEIDSQ